MGAAREVVGGGTEEGEAWAGREEKREVAGRLGWGGRGQEDCAREGLVSISI